MARTLATDTQNILKQDEISCALFVTVEVGNGQMTSTKHRMWTGVGTININGHDYDGLGNLLSISSVTESADMGAKGLTLQLIGNATFLTAARDKDYQNKLVEVLVAMKKSDGTYDTPFTYFSGFGDTMTMVKTENTCVVRLKAESKLMTLSKASNRRYTLRDQLIDFASDQCFRFLESTAEQEVKWGRE